MSDERLTAGFRVPRALECGQPTKSADGRVGRCRLAPEPGYNPLGLCVDHHAAYRRLCGSAGDPGYMLVSYTRPIEYPGDPSGYGPEKTRMT